METVYCVFESDIDGDGYLRWKFILVSSTPSGALAGISSLPVCPIYSNTKWTTLHPSMTKENLYTVFHSRDEISKLYNMEDYTFANNQPCYVIESQPLQ